LEFSSDVRIGGVYLLTIYLATIVDRSIEYNDKQEYHTIPQSNRKIVAKGKIDIPNFPGLAHALQLKRGIAKLN
jgi:hypothetical protein